MRETTLKLCQVTSVLTFSYRSQTGLGKVSVPDIQAAATILLGSVKEMAD
jgi:hypothetical protein